MNYLYDKDSNRLRWLDKAYHMEANAIITIPPISDEDAEENRITVTLGGERMRVDGSKLMRMETRPQEVDKEELLGCSVCGADASQVLVEPVWISDTIGWQGLCTCSVCGTESIGQTSLYEDKATWSAIHTWNEGFVHVRREERD